MAGASGYSRRSRLIAAVPRRFLRGTAWALAAGILVAILFLSLSSAGAPGGFALADKFWHALAYAALTVSVLVALPRRLSPWWVVVGAVALGAIVEVIQGVDLFATRQPDVWDAVADAAGALGGLWAWHSFRRR